MTAPSVKCTPISQLESPQAGKNKAILITNVPGAAKVKQSQEQGIFKAITEEDWDGIVNEVDLNPVVVGSILGFLV